MFSVNLLLLPFYVYLIAISFFLNSVEVDKEFNPPPPKVDYTSTTKKDFSRGTICCIMLSSSPALSVVK